MGALNSELNSVNSALKLAIVAAVVLTASPSHAQAPKANTPRAAAQATPAAPAPQPDPSAAPQPGWSARCSSVARNGPLECAIEQTAVLSKTGQLIVLVNIRVPSDPRAGSAGAVAAWPQPAEWGQAPGRRGQGRRRADPDLRSQRLLCEHPDHAGSAGDPEVG